MSVRLRRIGRHKPLYKFTVSVGGSAKYGLEGNIIAVFVAMSIVMTAHGGIGIHGIDVQLRSLAQACQSEGRVALPLP